VRAGVRKPPKYEPAGTRATLWGFEDSGASVPGRGACNLTLSYYKAQFSRLCAKHGAKKAFCAVAASMLTAIYHMLKDGVEHKDLGVSYFDKRSTDIKAKRLVAQLTKLGFQVNLQPIKEAA